MPISIPTLHATLPVERHAYHQSNVQQRVSSSSDPQIEDRQTGQGGRTLDKIDQGVQLSLPAYGAFAMLAC